MRDDLRLVASLIIARRSVTVTKFSRSSLIKDRRPLALSPYTPSSFQINGLKDSPLATRTKADGENYRLIGLPSFWVRQA
jgi:hypothetical protein